MKWMKRFFCKKCNNYFQDSTIRDCPACGSHDVIEVKIYGGMKE
jgi:RNA polymerase subunit RPABC4/transcription elongation factor Spt4